MCNKKESNKEWSTNHLISNGVKFQSKNDGYHLIIDHNGKKINFWPSTGRFISSDGRHDGRGVHNLMYILENKGCMVCGQFPYFTVNNMCGVCTFGEAEAQQELINGKYDDGEVVYG